MSMFLRLLHLPDAAFNMDVRRFFSGYRIPNGGVQIIGGSNGEALIWFESHGDVLRSCAELDNKCILGQPVRLFIGHDTEGIQGHPPTISLLPTKSANEGRNYTTSAPLPRSEVIDEHQKCWEVSPSSENVQRELQLKCSSTSKYGIDDERTNLKETAVPVMEVTPLQRMDSVLPTKTSVHDYKPSNFVGDTNQQRWITRSTGGMEQNIDASTSDRANISMRYAVRSNTGERLTLTNESEKSSASPLIPTFRNDKTSDADEQNMMLQKEALHILWKQQNMSGIIQQAVGTDNNKGRQKIPLDTVSQTQAIYDLTTSHDSGPSSIATEYKQEAANNSILEKANDIDWVRRTIASRERTGQKERCYRRQEQISSEEGRSSEKRMRSISRERERERSISRRWDYDRAQGYKRRKSCDRKLGSRSKDKIRNKEGRSRSTSSDERSGSISSDGKSSSISSDGQSSSISSDGQSCITSYASSTSNTNSTCSRSKEVRSNSKGKEWRPHSRSTEGRSRSRSMEGRSCSRNIEGRSRRRSMEGRSCSRSRERRSCSRHTESRSRSRHTESRSCSMIMAGQSHSRSMERRSHSRSMERRSHSRSMVRRSRSRSMEAQSRRSIEGPSCSRSTEGRSYGSMERRSRSWSKERQLHRNNEGRSRRSDRSHGWNKDRLHRSMDRSPDRLMDRYKRGRRSRSRSRERFGPSFQRDQMRRSHSKERFYSSYSSESRIHSRNVESGSWSQRSIHTSGNRSQSKERVTYKGGPSGSYSRQCSRDRAFHERSPYRERRRGDYEREAEEDSHISGILDLVVAAANESSETVVKDMFDPNVLISLSFLLIKSFNILGKAPSDLWSMCGGADGLCIGIYLREIHSRHHEGNCQEIILAYESLKDTELTIKNGLGIISGLAPLFYTGSALLHHLCDPAFTDQPLFLSKEPGCNRTCTLSEKHSLEQALPALINMKVMEVDNQMDDGLHCVRMMKLNQKLTACEIWNWFKGNQGPSTGVILVCDKVNRAMYAYVSFTNEGKSILDSYHSIGHTITTKALMEAELSMLDSTHHLFQSSVSGKDEAIHFGKTDAGKSDLGKIEVVLTKSKKETTQSASKANPEKQATTPNPASSTDSKIKNDSIKQTDNSTTTKTDSGQASVSTPGEVSKSKVLKVFEPPKQPMQHLRPQHTHQFRDGWQEPINTGPYGRFQQSPRPFMPCMHFPPPRMMPQAFQPSLRAGFSPMHMPSWGFDSPRFRPRILPPHMRSPAPGLPPMPHMGGNYGLHAPRNKSWF